MVALRYGIGAFIIILVFMLPASAQNQSKDDEYLIRGLLRDGLNEVAADKIFEFVFKYPGHSRSEKMVVDICTVLVSENNMEKALPLLKCYLQEFPEGSNQKKIKLMLAESLVALGEHSEAAIPLQEIINDSGYRDTDRIYAKVMLSQIYLSQGRYQVAKTLLEETGPKSSGPLARLALAESYVGLAQFREAEEILRPLSNRRRNDDNRKRAKRLLSQLYLDSARYQECAELFSGWQPPEDDEYNEHDAHVALALAVSNYHLGNFETAYEFASPLISQMMDETDTAPYLPGVLIALQEWSSAAALLKQSFTAANDSFNRRAVGMILIDTLVAAGMDEDALEVISNLVALMNGGDEKARLLLRAADLETDTDEILGYRAQALSFAKSKELKADIHFLNAGYYRNSGLLDRSLQEYDSILSLSVSGHSNARVHYEKGLIHVKPNNFEAAASEFEMAISIDTNAPFLNSAHLELIKCYYHQRKWHSIIDTYEAYTEKYPVHILPFDASRALLVAALTTGNDDLALSIARNAFLESTHDSQEISSKLLLSMSQLSQERADADFEEALLKSLASHETDSIRLTAAAALIHSYANSELWDQALKTSNDVAVAADDLWIGQWARFMSARFYGKLGRRQEQVAELQSIMDDGTEKPFFDASLRELQSIALSSGNYSGALQADPFFVINSPARLFEADGKLRQAQRFINVRNFGAALNIYATYPNTAHLPPVHKFNYACSLFESGELLKSYRLFESVTPDQLTLPLQWQRKWMMAVAQVKQEDYPAALEKLQELLELPIDEDLRFKILLQAARAEEAMGNWNEAAGYYDSYIERARSRDVAVSVFESVAQAYLAHDDIDKAISIYEHLELLEENAQQSIQYRFRIVELIELLEGPEAAAEEYLNVAYRNTDMEIWPARARLRAAAIYEKLKMFDKAERQYKFVAENYARTEEGVAAARKLGELVKLKDRVEEEQLDNPGQR